MLAPTKKRPIETVEARFVGTPEGIGRLREVAREEGVADISDAVPWREAFQEFADNTPGTLVSGFRHRENMTQETLSHITGIPRRHISEIENGKRTMGKVNAKKIAAVLKTDYRMFL